MHGMDFELDEHNDVLFTDLTSPFLKVCYLVNYLCMLFYFLKKLSQNYKFGGKSVTGFTTGFPELFLEFRIE